MEQLQFPIDVAYREQQCFQMTPTDRSIIMSIGIITKTEAYQRHFLNAFCEEKMQLYQQKKRATAQPAQKNHAVANRPVPAAHNPETTKRAVDNLKKSLCSKIANFIENKRSFCAEVVS